MSSFSNNRDLEDSIKDLEESVNSIINILKLKKGNYFVSNDGNRVYVITGTTANNYPIESKILYNAEKSI